MDLNLRWDDGQLAWYDPATGQHIATFDSQRSRADSERSARLVAEDRADAELAAELRRQDADSAAAEFRAVREARIAAGARIRELEEKLRRRNSQPLQGRLAMVHRQPITSLDFFSNAAARNAGFTDQFWHQAYQLYLDEAARDPDPALDIKYTRPRSIRMPFREGHVDVIVRAQPEPREYVIMRLTAFPADGEDGSDADQSGWWYVHNEQRPALGEGALLDENTRW